MRPEFSTPTATEKFFLRDGNILSIKLDGSFDTEIWPLVDELDAAGETDQLLQILRAYLRARLKESLWPVL